MYRVHSRYSVNVCENKGPPLISSQPLTTAVFTRTLSILGRGGIPRKEVTPLSFTALSRCWLVFHPMKSCVSIVLPGPTLSDDTSQWHYNLTSPVQWFRLQSFYVSNLVCLSFLKLCVCISVWVCALLQMFIEVSKTSMRQQAPLQPFSICLFNVCL